MRRCSLVLLVWAVACDTEPHGARVELDFGDVSLVAAGAPGDGSGGLVNGVGGSTGTTDGGTGGDVSGSAGSGGTQVVTYGPPVVDRFTPGTGPWGTPITISGSDLGSASRSDSLLRVGSELMLSPGDAGIESWTESEIILRIPFPHEGEVTIATAEGSVVAGTFTPTHEVAAEQAIAGNVDVLSSVSLNAGSISLALSTDPQTVVTFDGEAWRTEALPEADLRTETLNLYAGDAGELRAVALSSASPPEIVELAPGASEPVSTGVVVTESVWVAGGPDSAAVWYWATGGFYRARPVSGVWQVDKGPIANPASSEELDTAAATSDGSLWLAWARKTGPFGNDKGAPFARRLAPDVTSWGKEFQCGVDLDDRIIEIVLKPRGRGLIVDYCGVDANAIGLGPDDIECRTGVLLSTGSETRSTAREGETTRHAVDLTSRVTATCDATGGTTLVGAVWAWPCQTIGALEIDPAGAAVLVVRHDGKLKLLRRR